ncbi:hypothetical protein CK203_065444 [Vitis vinifera]|uniref:Reverse transcriptase domain-containing protein n=1 Tax=Vitis vinifera TaxID=29760 RepID=A0A438G336_VITVI|nr:hypothetical protein CK203_065444 [Vitis vinifera]
MIGLVRYSVLVQVLRIQSSFNLLLGRPWIHEAGAIPSFLHQKYYRFSHSEDDLHLTGFTFDEHDERHVLPARLRIGRHQQGPCEFTFTVDHDIPYGLGYTPTEKDARYMARLRKDRMHLGIRIPKTPDVMIVAPPSHRLSQHVFVCFPEIVFDYDILMNTMIDVDGVTLPDACTDEMDMIGVGRILDAVPHSPHSDFDFFKVSMIDTDDVTLYDVCIDEMDMIALVIDDDDTLLLFTPDVITIEGAFDSVDPPFSFDTMSGFVTRFDDVVGGNNNDMSVFEYSPMSLHFPLIVPPTPMTYIHDVDDVRVPDGLLSDQSDFDLDSEEKKIKEEIQKQLNADFLSVVEYPESLANVVLIPKKDGKILMALEDRRRHLSSLSGALTTIGLRLNPKKCTFGMTSGKLLGHIVSERDIEVDPKKIRAILDMPAPRIEREIRGFLGRQ